MSKPKALARDFGIKTADQVVPPKPKPPAEKTQRLTPEEKQAFKWLEPAALVLVSRDGPLSVTTYEPGGETVRRRFGHNRGVWPARLVNTSAWDKASVDRIYGNDPMVEYAGMFRVWCLTKPQRDRLAESVLDLIAARAEADGAPVELRKGFSDLGPELSLEFFEMEFHAIATRLRISTWDDHGFKLWLGHVYREAEAIAARHGNRVTQRLFEKIAIADVEKATART